MKAHFGTLSKVLVLICAFLAGSALLLAAGVYLYLSPELPSAQALQSVKLQTPLRIYTRDQRLIAEFGEKRRTPVAREQIPPEFIQAILAAEDDNFYSHSGVDIGGLLRAASELALSGEIQSGGSTITMQLARNFFLTAEQSFIRKFNEILLALRIEDDLSKDEILTLYANKIYLGNRAYGIGAAARVYYGTTIDQLELHQLAMIAGLPKAPSAFNPLSNPERATARRNWILGRMLKLGYIDQAQYREAVNTPDVASYHNPGSEVNAPYVAEMARREAVQRWGTDAYTAGLVVTTTVDGDMQQAANHSMIEGLHIYDRRHGYRGPEKHVDDPEQWPAALEASSPVHDLQPAIVTKVTEASATLLLEDQQSAELVLADQGEIRKYISQSRFSNPVEDLTEILDQGDLIRVRREDEGPWQLTQVPRIQGALVSLDPDNGAIRALVGGYDFDSSHFNRATQAERQPGSNFKPFIYTRALEEGMSPATVINDAPLVFRDPYLEKAWRPENDSGRFYGPTRLRKALYLSRNLVSIRILRQLGVERVLEGMGRFGFDTEALPRNLSLALGTQDATPLTIANGYTIFANGGYRVDTHLVDQVDDADGNAIFRARPATVCRDCDATATGEEDIPVEASTLQELFADGEDATANPETSPPPAERAVDARIAWIMDSMLKDVIKRGTGRKAQSLGREDIGGKTGTTNGPRDAWFSGYNPNLVTTVWVGFDENLTLGKNEYGGSAALPVWIDFMEQALNGKPEIQRPQPPGIVTVRIDPETGRRVRPGTPDAIFEYFLQERVPPLTDSGNNDGNDDERQPLPEGLY